MFAVMLVYANRCAPTNTRLKGDVENLLSFILPKKTFFSQTKLFHEQTNCRCSILSHTSNYLVYFLLCTKPVLLVRLTVKISHCTPDLATKYLAYVVFNRMRLYR